MKDILIHYGVKGMKWGVRKEYEGTGGGGGGGWGPNTIAGGGGPSPLAASMAGNPKKKKRFGKAEAKKMGIQDNAVQEKAKAKAEVEKDAQTLGDSLAKIGSLENAITALQSVGAEVPPELQKDYYDSIDKYMKDSAALNTKYEDMITHDLITENGKDYVMTLIYDSKYEEMWGALSEVPDVQFQEKK